MTIHPIAHAYTDFPTKFGIPRQSGLVQELTGTILFEPPYRVPEALRGLEGFSHLWLIWGFSATDQTDWSPPVRPPRLGGNTRMGVFATRSPFRPNPLGLSAVAIESIEDHPTHGPLIHIRGADLLNGTPIYDIKPYLPYTDSLPDALGGFADSAPPTLTVKAEDRHLAILPPEKRAALLAVLAQDPRPSYQRDPDRVHGLQFSGCEIKFRITDEVLTVIEIERL